MKMCGNRHNLMSIVARILLGGVLIFSSVAKGLDPYGTVLKIGEYIDALHLHWAEPAATPLAVALIGLEMLVGVALVVGAVPRLTSRVALILNGFFMLFTLWIAIAEPVAECGCFGDVLHLTNWQTFAKNVVLVALSIVVLRGSAGRKGRVWSAVVSLAMMCCVVALSLYGLVMLPVVDRFPFGEGVNIAEAMQRARSEEMGQTFVVCRNLSSGEERKFSVEDKEWWNEEVWEFVRTESPASDDVRVTVRDFRLTSGSFDITDQILAMPYCRLLCVEDVMSLSPEELTKLRRIGLDCVAKGDRVVVVTASPLRRAESLFPGLEFCNMDATALRALLRAPAGVVTLKRGVVMQKVSLAALR